MPILNHLVRRLLTVGCTYWTRMCLNYANLKAMNNRSIPLISCPKFFLKMSWGQININIISMSLTDPLALLCAVWHQRQLLSIFIMQQKCRRNKRLIEHRKTIHALKAQLTVYTQAYVNSYKQHVKKNANVILAGKDITEQVVPSAGRSCFNSVMFWIKKSNNSFTAGTFWSDRNSWSYQKVSVCTFKLKKKLLWKGNVFPWCMTWISKSVCNCLVFNALQKSQVTPHFLYILLVKWEIGAAACANIQLSPYIFGHWQKFFLYRLLKYIPIIVIEWIRK